ncbi:MAG: hypothetical protein AAGD96_27470 [Chloroflexota bacterium]
MAKLKLQQSTKSYVLRLYRFQELDSWKWRIVLAPLNAPEEPAQGFTSIEELAQFLNNQKLNLENNNE